MKKVEHNILNGVNVDQLRETIDLVKKDPENAIFKFKAKTNWLEASQCKTEIKEFYGAKKVNRTNSDPFIIHGDEPSVLLGGNSAPNSVEMILHALGSCLTVGFIYNAAVIGIKVNSLSFELEGELDLQSFLGIIDDLRPGYKMIRVMVHADTDGSDEQIFELMRHVKRTSPVLDMLTNSVPVKFDMV